MNYEEAVSYIDGLQMFAKKHSTDHTRIFLSYLGNPQKNKKIIHVAGTNGKGSVCRYMQALLVGEGRKTGMFTSPHLVTIRERIQIGESIISKKQFLEIFLTVKEAVEKMGDEGIDHPTYFEFLFGMAMKAFDEEQMEYIILETGLGGRLDATNSILYPTLTIITSIGLDHTEILGDTIEKIAAEKAGIIKAGVPLIYDGTNKEAAEILKNTAENIGVKCREISENAFKIQKITEKDIAFLTANRYDDTAEWKLRTTGIYQPINAVIALEAMQMLIQKPQASWCQILEKTVWPGRMDEIRPGVILDGAHNMHALRVLAKSIQIQKQNMETDGRLIVLFSAVREKDYHDMIRFICHEIPSDLIVVTQLLSNRATKASELKEEFEQYTRCPVVEQDSVSEACRFVLGQKKDKDRVYCFGSLYLVGEVERMLREESGC